MWYMHIRRGKLEQGEETYRETAMEERKGIVVFEATTDIKKNGRWRLESLWCAKESPKTLPINTLWL